MISLSDIQIRTELQPGDMGYVIHLHGKLYQQEYQYPIQFEKYVAEGLLEFYNNYNSTNNRVWVCEYKDTMVGFMLLMNRGSVAQLRYFLLVPAVRGIGLGKKLMEYYMSFLKEAGYNSSYLLTTNELTAAAHLYKRHGFKLTEQKESTTFGKQAVEQRYDLVY